LRDKYGDERRTEITEAVDDIDIEDLIARHTCVITMTREGYVKRVPASTYAAQNRGGRGLVGMKTKEEDYVSQMLVANSHSFVLMFTNLGKVHAIKAYRIPESSRQAKGTNAVNILDLAEGERVSAMIAVDAFPDNEYLTLVTKQGVIKRTLLSAYAYQRKGGKLAITLDEGDELWFVRHTKGAEELVIATECGMATRFSGDTVRPMGRTARGVRGIRLADDDRVVGVAVVDETKALLTVTRNGFGKRVDFADFREMKNRGGRGVTCQKISDKTGRLSSVATVAEDDDVMLITSTGTMIRVPVGGIPVYSRTAGGVIIMRTAEDAEILTFARVEREEDILREVAAAEETLATLPPVTSELPDEPDGEAAAAEDIAEADTDTDGADEAAESAEAAAEDNDTQEA
jgi:DNA gyrase subunit A